MVKKQHGGRMKKNQEMERQRAAEAMFRADPIRSLRSVSDAFKAATGQGMNQTRLRQIRDQVVEDLQVEIEKEVDKVERTITLQVKKPSLVARGTRALQDPQRLFAISLLVITGIVTAAAVLIAR